MRTELNMINKNTRNKLTQWMMVERNGGDVMAMEGVYGDVVDNSIRLGCLSYPWRLKVDAGDGVVC